MNLQVFTTGSADLKQFLASVSKPFHVRRCGTELQGREWSEHCRFLVTYDNRFFVECYTWPGQVALAMGPEIPIRHLGTYLTFETLGG